MAILLQSMTLLSFVGLMLFVAGACFSRDANARHNSVTVAMILFAFVVIGLFLSGHYAGVK